MTKVNSKHTADSQVILSQFMQPEHANALGNVHGGWIMKLIDEAGGLCATRHARRPAVTLAVDSLRFLSPVHVGDFVTFTAHLNWVGHTAMEVEVNVEAENLLTGEKTHTNSAYLVFVALDQAGHPVEVPGLILETEDERRRWGQGTQRQADRLSRAKREAA
ncbi:acyl-CoA thioesterase YciA [Thermoflexales bacterium]|nr:acyl-CoA thioesterase YciA [Thermoflexales bacterium]